MSALFEFERQLAAAWPVEAWRDRVLLLAVSGGADSVAMLRALVRLRMQAGGSGRLIVAHFNHRLRAAESDADQRFVQQLAQQLELPCEIGSRDLSLPFDPAGDGLEAAARQMRYHFMQATAERLAARYLVTAHTADDQAETVLHHVLRGSGLVGLGGIRRVRTLGDAVTLIRPLLEVRRVQVVQYLEQLGQPHCHDASNNDRELTRNRIRHDLLPKLAAEFSPGVVDSLLRLGRLAAEAQEVFDQLATRLLERCLRHESAECISLERAVLSTESRYLIRETLVAAWKGQDWPRQAMGFAEWDALAEMIVHHAAPLPPRTFPGRIMAQQTGERLSLTRLLD